MNGPLEFIHTSKMIELLTSFSFHRSLFTMEIVRVLIFASLVAGTFGFFWPIWQPGQEIRPWNLADQMEEKARLEKLCKENDRYCDRLKPSWAKGHSRSIPFG